ncbi:hypothetical protein ACOWLP_00795 [Helicobacter pylori]
MKENNIITQENYANITIIVQEVAKLKKQVKALQQEVAKLKQVKK